VLWIIGAMVLGGGVAYAGYHYFGRPADGAADTSTPLLSDSGSPDSSSTTGSGDTASSDSSSSDSGSGDSGGGGDGGE
jgi:hypothetical protein